MKKKLQQRIDAFRNNVGYIPALNALMQAGLSKSIAQKLLAGTYPSEPKGLHLRAIETVLRGK